MSDPVLRIENVHRDLNNFQPLIEETIDTPSEYNSSYTKVEGWLEKTIDLDNFTVLVL